MKLLPMKPEPPVTRMRFTGRSSMRKRDETPMDSS
jgi:hypothetical protein